MIRFSAVAVVTIDGKIAKDKDHFTNWSSFEDKKFLKSQIDRSDLIILGRQTFEMVKKRLPSQIFNKRHYLVFTSKPAEKSKYRNVAWIKPTKKEIRSVLKSGGYHNICVLGGTSTYSTLLAMNLISDIYLTVEPIIFGSGMPLFDKTQAQKKFKLSSMKKLNSKGTILLHYVRID